MLKAEKIKGIIKKKFRTTARFGRIIGIDPYEVRRILNESKDNDPMLKMLLSLSIAHNDVVLPGEMDDKTRRSIVEKIEKAGGVLKFSKHHPEFAVSTIYRIISGKVKKIDRKSEEIIKHFGL